MASQKKFGTFSGVLTPSLLTILGVIMYMRLGSVVGNSSSILQFISIIFFAHLISITTGLSVSSIATDKKIDKGGIYYMLTRSLGLPIGGAIGLTIFIATAFSISLYLIGFSESLIPVINEDWAVGGISTNKLRLFGSIALIIVLTIAYISTSFALKIQYVILGLIVLSLGSVFLGSSDGLKVGSDIIESPSFATLFGIFFPAVTGFTAGVAMSGDLKNPKISIPWGTMLSISIGLIIYILLSLFIYYNIDGEFLRSNNNVLIEYGAIPLLVLGGVWGATLSSALGGILGGPRILQAMSLDNITPNIFAKESGLNKEPRNALFLTFLIAEIGILIGELNVIAELVAMFYMAAYLFINISCFLEQWSSPDFRPKFKIPIWISLLGAISTLLLMIQLNLGATLISVLLMMIFWFWLSKKDLVLGTGDVWLSVWNTVVKTGLKNLQKKTVHKRNWQPNILLFSGGTSNRPHLIDFGKSIIGRAGMVSNFDLIETKSAKVLFPKSDQNTKDNLIIDDSIFHRKLYCQNVFKGIESIATTYGFSGVDPNTVLMGWAKNTKDPIWFSEMTQKLKDLDYNILYLDYDQNRGFGSFSSIDLWWDGFNKENELSLQLVKFLRSSKKWKKAVLNIYFVNSKNTSSDEIELKISSIIDRKRMNAEYHVINNYLEQKNINEYIRIKSHQSDLILIKLPKLKVGSEKKFIQSSNELFGEIGSALFLEAANSFQDDFKIETTTKTIKNPKNVVLKEKISGSIIRTFDNNFDKQTNFWHQELKQINKSFINDIQSSIVKFEEYYINVYNNSKLLDELKRHLFNTDKVKYIADDLEFSTLKNIENYFNLINDFLSKIPPKINFKYSLEFLENSNFSNSLYNKKLKTNYLNGKKEINTILPVLKLIDYHLKNNFVSHFNRLLRIFGSIHLKYIKSYKDFIRQEKKKDILPVLNVVNTEIFSELNEELNLLVTKLLNAVIKDIGENNVKVLAENREDDFNPKSYRKKWGLLEEFPFGLSKNVFVFHNIKALYCCSIIVENLAFKQINELSIIFNKNTFVQIEELLSVSTKKASLKKQVNINNWIDQLQRTFGSVIRSLESSNWMMNNDDIFDKIPSEINLYSAEILDNFLIQQNNLIDKQYNLKSSLQFLYSENIIFPINNTAKEYREWLIEEFEELISSFKLVVFTMDNQNSPELLKDAKKKLIFKIDDFKKNSTLKKQRLNSYLEDLKINTRKFSDYHFLMSNESKKYVDLSSSSSKSPLVKIQNFISEKFLSIVDLVTTEESPRELLAQSDKIKIIRNFVQECNPSQTQLDNLPKLYLQLFTNSAKPSTFFSEFIENKIHEIKKSIASKSIKSQNVIVVSGESKSGKTYILNNLIESFKEKNCFAVDPPNYVLNNSVETQLSKLLHKVNDNSSDLIDLEELENGSIVFLNDFDLWWRKNKNGYNAINNWLDIFQRYENKLVFIIEINKHFLNHLRINSDIDKSVLKYISTLDFSKKQLESIVKFKNSLAGIDIYSKGNKINFSKSLRSALNFNKINAVTNGNIGWFNNFWIASIIKNETNIFEFSNDFKTVFPDVLNNTEIMVLLQVFLHKKINLKYLNEYFSTWDEALIAEYISFFKDENILSSEGSYVEISQYVLPYLNWYFNNKNLIAN